MYTCTNPEKAVILISSCSQITQKALLLGIRLNIVSDSNTHQDFLKSPRLMSNSKSIPSRTQSTWHQQASLTICSNNFQIHILSYYYHYQPYIYIELLSFTQEDCKYYPNTQKQNLIGSSCQLWINQPFKLPSHYFSANQCPYRP